MADEKVDSVVKTFPNIQFPKMEAKYDLKLQFDAHSETLGLQFRNKDNTKTYRSSFSKEDIDRITTRCQLSSGNLCQVIMDQLSATEFINKFCRLFIFNSLKQGMRPIYYVDSSSVSNDECKSCIYTAQRIQNMKYSPN